MLLSLNKHAATIASSACPSIHLSTLFVLACLRQTVAMFSGTLYLLSNVILYTVYTDQVQLLLNSVVFKMVISIKCQMYGVHTVHGVQHAA